MMNNCTVPEVGRIYIFLDDGKQDREYCVKVVDVIAKEDMKDQNVFNAWEKEKTDYDLLYAKDTKYFVKGICTEYSNFPIWFVQTINDGWFSIDYPEFWMSGRLLVD